MKLIGWCAIKSEISVFLAIFQEIQYFFPALHCSKVLQYNTIQPRFANPSILPSHNYQLENTMISHAFCTLSALIICLLAFTSTYGEETQNRPTAQPDNKITIVTEDFPPWNFPNAETGKTDGICTDIVRAVLKEAQLDPNTEITINPWPRTYKMAQEEKNVLIYSLKRTESRETEFQWIGELVKAEATLMVLKSSPIQASTNLDDFKKFSIAVLRSGASFENLQSDGFTNLDGSNYQEANWKKLKAGNVDMWCITPFSAQFILKKNGDDPDLIRAVHSYQKNTDAQFYIAFSKHTDDTLVNKLRNAYDTIKKNGTYEQILKKWGYDQSIKPDTFSAAGSSQTSQHIIHIAPIPFT